ncbi:MAG: helix-hairpin-helix domain-containing protein [Acidimicrobiia bacterium]
MEESEFWDRQFDEPTLPRARVERGLPRPEVPTRPRARYQREPSAFFDDDRWARAREWLHDRRNDPRAGVAVLVAIAIVAGFVWYRIGIGGEAGATPSVKGNATASGAPTPTTRGSSSAGGAPSTSAAAHARIAVHVAGAVAHPGVVELANGARVIDAVEAVGGATADGDVDRLNLAAKVADGTRLYVARKGETDPGVIGGGSDPAASGGATSTAGAGGATTGVKVNLNTATQAQLEELPGIGPTYAQSILAERQRRGTFKSVNELREVRGIGDKRFAELAPLVTV